MAPVYVMGWIFQHRNGEMLHQLPKVSELQRPDADARSGWSDIFAQASAARNDVTGADQCVAARKATIEVARSNVSRSDT
jgi:hypothetical protein